MPPISFLDLVPKRPHATVVIESEDGPAEFEVTGVSLSALADLGRKFPAFARVVEGGAGLLSATEAMPALIAAGLGHHGDPEYEQQAAQLPADIIIALAAEVVKLTFPQRPTLVLGGAESVPMAEGANGLLPEAILPSQLSN
jgi:hypothetical protein